MHKSRWVWIAVVAAGIVAEAVIAERPAGGDRPSGVAEDQWVKLGDQAGLVVELHSPKEVAVGRLWVKVKREWHATMIEAPTDGVVPAAAEP